VKLKFYQLFGLLFLLGLGVSACSHRSQSNVYNPVYQFKDGPIYRVEAKYTFEHNIQKSHQGKIFADQKEGLYVRATFNLTTQILPDQMIQAAYTLLNISIHDKAGRFRMEIGPQNGSIYWYGEEEDLQSYLGEKGFREYRAHIINPLAIVTIDLRGVQINDNETEASPPRLKFNYPFIQLLGKNRVIGQIIVKSFKIPPVLMTIFSDEPLAVGKKWVYQGPAMQRFTEWDNPLTTVFQLQSAEKDRLTIVLNSKLKFTGEELTNLGKQIGLTEFEQVKFERGLFTVEGKSRFQVRWGRPETGEMIIRKQYGLKVREEEWKLSEIENYEFSLQPESLSGKEGN